MAPNTCTCGGPNRSRRAESAACTSSWYLTPASRMVLVTAESVGPKNVASRLASHTLCCCADCSVSLAIADKMWSLSASDDAFFPFPFPLGLAFSFAGAVVGTILSAASGSSSVRRFFPPSIPEGTDEATLSCHPDVVVALRYDASSSMSQNTGVFGTPEELDFWAWQRQVVSAREAEKLCRVRAPLVTDPPLKLMILAPRANDVCVQAALSGTVSVFVTTNKMVDGRGPAGKYRAAVWARIESDPS